MQEKEKETTLRKPVVFFASALAHSTPCDLAGRETQTERERDTDTLKTKPQMLNPEP